MLTRDTGLTANERWSAYQDKGEWFFSYGAEAPVPVKDIDNLKMFTDPTHVAEFIQSCSETEGIHHTDVLVKIDEVQKVLFLMVGVNMNGVITGKFIDNDIGQYAPELLRKTIDHKYLSINWSQFIEYMERSISSLSSHFKRLSEEERGKSFIRSVEAELDGIIEIIETGSSEVKSIFDEKNAFILTPEDCVYWKFLISSSSLSHAEIYDLNFNGTVGKDVYLTVRKHIVFALLIMFVHVSADAIRPLRRKGRISINAHIRTDKTGNSHHHYLFLSVMDNGRKINDGENKHLASFDRLYRYRELIKKQGGLLKYRHEAGVGNEMSLWIPIILPK